MNGTPAQTAQGNQSRQLEEAKFPSQILSPEAEQLMAAIREAIKIEGANGDPHAVLECLTWMANEYRRQLQDSGRVPRTQDNACQVSQAIPWDQYPLQIELLASFSTPFQVAPQTQLQAQLQAPFQAPFQIRPQALPPKIYQSDQELEPAGSSGPAAGGRPSDMRTPRGSCLVEGCPRYGEPQLPCQLREHDEACHRGIRHRCPEAGCLASFTYRRDLLRHMRGTHGESKIRRRVGSPQPARRRARPVVFNQALEPVPRRDHMPELRAQGGGGVTGQPRFEYLTNPHQPPAQHGCLVTAYPGGFPTAFPDRNGEFAWPPLF